MSIYTIKDKEGRLWELETDAKEETIRMAIKFLDSMDIVTIPKLENLLLEFNYAVGLKIVPEPSINFEL